MTETEAKAIAERWGGQFAHWHEGSVPMCSYLHDGACGEPFSALPGWLGPRGVPLEWEALVRAHRRVVELEARVIELELAYDLIRDTVPLQRGPT